MPTIIEVNIHLNNKGLALFKLGRIEKALMDYSKAIEIYS